MHSKQSHYNRIEAIVYSCLQNKIASVTECFNACNAITYTAFTDINHCPCRLGLPKDNFQARVPVPVNGSPALVLVLARSC